VVEDAVAGAAGFGGFETVDVRHPRQITMALPTLTFSRSHHAVLFGRGSERSDCFESLEAADV
jgi:hypothetical protein